MTRRAWLLLALVACTYGWSQHTLHGARVMQRLASRIDRVGVALDLREPRGYGAGAEPCGDDGCWDGMEPIPEPVEVQR